MSIFELKHDEADLASANQGASRMQYDQHAPTRDVTGANFPNGAIHVRWQVSGQRWWIPARSYLRFRCKLTDATGAIQLFDAQDVAPAMGMIANLFQSAEFRINDKTVSRCADFMPQVDALETRISKSKAWLDGVGASQNYWSPSVDYNRSQIVQDGAVAPIAPIVSNKVQLGFGAAVTVAYVTATGVVTFSAASSNVLAFDVGDTLQIDYKLIGTTGAGGAGAALVITSTPISGVITAVAVNGLTVTIQAGLTLADVAAVDVPFYRIAAPKKSRRTADFEVTWQPPLSIFKTCHALPTGRYELILNPHVTSVYKLLVAESKRAAKIPRVISGGGGAGGDYDFSVAQMYMYVATIEGPRADDTTFLIDLEETRLQVDSTPGGTVMGQKNFDVSPSTFALTLAFQDQRCSSNSLLNTSKFKVGDDATALRTNQELTLNRMFLQYAGQSKPSPDADPAFDAGATIPQDYTYQRYIESVLGTGGYFDSGSPESLEDWQDRGAYYYFPWSRDASDRSTRVQVNAQFRVGSAQSRILLFDHSRAVARIKIEGGAVVDVDVQSR